MRLAEQVVVIDGAKRSALYDLAANRIRRIPAHLADGLRSSDIKKAISKEWQTHLVNTRFLVDDDAQDLLRPYAPSFTSPRTPLVHTATLDFAVTLDRRFSEWLTAARHYLCLAHLVVMTRPEDEIEATRFLHECNLKKMAASCELIVRSEKRPWLGKLFDSNMQVRIWRRFLPGPLSLSDFIQASAETYSLLRSHSELSGHIYIDQQGYLRPHWDEEELSFGSIDEPLASAIKSKPFSETQHNSKDQREQCQNCEIRYACINPFCYRINKDISSAPSNCAYDPLSLAPQNALFEVTT